MTGGPAARMLADGQRLHLQHGPIDLIVEAFADDRAEVEAAYAQLWRRFQTVLSPLVDELTDLRRPLGAVYPLFRGPVARRMAAAVWPHRAVFVTPMAAVAGSVADECLAAMSAGRRLRKAYINNGGDIALHLAPGERLRLGIVDNPDRPALDAGAEIESGDPVRGLATSGWRGRSQSLGIADAVTVLARDAATADAAATLIANAVDVDHPAIERRPAREMKDDSDLGQLPVTVAVGALDRDSIHRALAAGLARAEELRRAGLVHAAYLALQGERRGMGARMPALPARETAR